MRLLRRQQCWMPTSRGWLLLAAVGGSIILFIARSIHPFLTVTQPIPAEALIVESWLPDYAARGAVEEFRHGKYKYVITTGLTLPEAWFASKYKTGAEFAAANLAALGLATNLVVPLPASSDRRDRTYVSALAVATWLEERGSTVRGVNVYTLGTHARRTRLLFRKALGPRVNVGVFACPEDSYDPQHWWASSSGFRRVAGESIAYIYARFWFHARK